MGSSLTCLQLHKRAEKIAALLFERGQLREGDHVALVYPPGNFTFTFCYFLLPKLVKSESSNGKHHRDSEIRTAVSN